MRKQHENHARTAWDDRIYDLFGTSVFQEYLEKVGEPLFWGPLIARHQGLRMEECLQLVLCPRLLTATLGAVG